MRTQYIHKAKISKGVIVFEQEKLFREQVATFEGYEVKITVERYRKNKSTKQLGYFWAVVVPAFQEAIYETQGIWFSIDNIYLMLLNGLSKEPIVDIFTGEILTNKEGIPIETLKSLSAMTTVEMNEFTNKCVHFALENFGVVIPPPDPEYFLTTKH